MYDDVFALFFYFLIFAVLHSILAAESLKCRAFELIPLLKRSYRLIYNFVAVATLMPVFLIVSIKSSTIIFSLSGPVALLLYSIKLLSFVLLLISIRPVLSDLSGMSALRGDNASGPLITSGMYAVTRHPIYLFTLIFLWANPRMTVNTFAAYVLVTSYAYIGSVFEERRLVKKFDGYKEYRRTTSRIIPSKWIFKNKLKIQSSKSKINTKS